MPAAAPISIVRSEQSLVLQGGAPAAIEIAHEGGKEIIIDRSDIPGPPGLGASGASTIERIAAQPLGGFRVVRVDSENTFRLCDPAAPFCAEACGITTGAAAQGAPATAKYSGEIVEYTWNWAEGAVFCGAGGHLTQVEPDLGTIVQIGNAVGPQSIRINIIYLADLA